MSNKTSENSSENLKDSTEAVTAENEASADVSQPSVPDASADAAAEPANDKSQPADASTEQAPKPKKKYSRFNKANQLRIIFTSLAVAFTVLFFSPIDIFLGNQREFAMDAGNIIKPMVIAAIYSALSLIVIQNLLLAIHEKVFKCINSLVFGTLCAMYVQMLFLNKRMVTITGDDTNYSTFSKFNIADLCIFAFIALLPFVLFLISCARPKGTLSKKGSAVVAYLAAVILVMQSFGTYNQFANHPIEHTEPDEFSNFMAFDTAVNFSKTEDNILVILADRMDGQWMDSDLALWPDLADELRDFTYYKDNISNCTNTFPALTQLLTNYKYQSGAWESYADYYKTAWGGDTLPRKLKNAGYQVSMILDNSTTYNSITQLKDQCDNIRSAEDYASINYFGEGGIIPTMTDFSFGKLVPYLFKNQFLGGYTADFSNTFLVVSEDIPERCPRAIGSNTDIAFYHYIKDHGITSDADKKTFSFIHMCFAHDANEEESQIYQGDLLGNITGYTTSRGAFAILNELFNQMREQGVYDNTTIVIPGDHGRPPVETEVYGEPELDDIIATTLLIKPAHTTGDFQINEDAQLSNSYFPASILDYAGIDHSEWGPSYNDLIASGDYPARELSVYTIRFVAGEDGGLLPSTDVEVVAYEVKGNSRDFANWTPIRHAASTEESSTEE